MKNNEVVPSMSSVSVKWYNLSERLFSSILSSRDFIISSVAFQSLIHFEFLFG